MFEEVYSEICNCFCDGEQHLGVCFQKSLLIGLLFKVN